MKKLVILSLIIVAGAGFTARSVMAQNNTQTTAPSPNVTKEQIDAAKQMYDSMTPEQKAALAEQVRAQAATMTPQQKEALVKRAKAHFDTLSPTEKTALKSRLLELGSRLTPQERADYLKRLD